MNRHLTRMGMMTNRVTTTTMMRMMASWTSIPATRMMERRKPMSRKVSVKRYSKCQPVSSDRRCCRQDYRSARRSLVSRSDGRWGEWWKKRGKRRSKLVFAISAIKRKWWRRWKEGKKGRKRPFLVNNPAVFIIIAMPRKGEQWQ